MLRLTAIHTYYGESHVLRGVSFEVREGSIVGLLGRNGMGKTTTINSIIGFNQPRQGSIWFKGHDITDLPPHQIVRMGIGLVPQGKRIFKRLTVLENLKAAMRNKGGSLTWDLDRVCSYFPVLRQRSGARAGQLSGGEQQMLAIARALVGNPDLLLMDEPSEGLAPVLIKSLEDVIKKLVEAGFAILLVEQNLSLTLKLADYIYIISNGQIVHESTAKFLRDNDQVVTQYLGV